MLRPAAPSLLVALALLAACSDGEDGARACLVTRECEPGEQCINQQCKARVAKACTSDVDCGPGGACLDAACAGGTACRRGADCGGGEACDVVQGTCVLSSCDDQGGCPNGGFCDARTNRCGPPRPCARDDQCGAPNGTCDGGFCAPGCGRAGCANGLSCSPASGRCVPASNCTADAACGAPASICEAGACVPGCGSSGCTGGLTCNLATGRCAGGGGCTSDAQCQPPSTICVGSSCIPGCGSTGCANGLSCNFSTGRCAGGGGCTSDAQCAPYEACDTGTGSCGPKGCSSPNDCGVPAGRCFNGTCIAGCGTNPCGSGETCDPSTGECNDGSIPEVPCNSNADCPGHYCLLDKPPGGPPGICADMCGATYDCPRGRRCMEAPNRPGVKVCLGRAAGAPVGPLQTDQQCKANGRRDATQCQSGICSPDERDGTIGTCEPGCSSDLDCFNLGFGEIPCRAYISVPGSYSTQACMGDISLFLLYDAYYPQPCNTDFGLNSCASLMCSNVSDHCFSPCCTSAECGRGSRCMPMLPVSLVTYEQTPTLLKGCAPQVDGSGNGGFGSACTPETFATCAANRCIEFDANGAATAGYCTDTCCRNADCPDGYACVADYDAESGYSWGVCARL